MGSSIAASGTMAAPTARRILLLAGDVATVVVLGLYWQRAFLQWWGYSLGGATPKWLPLSWHNQSAALMGALGVLCAGVMLRTRDR